MLGLVRVDAWGYVDSNHVRVWLYILRKLHMDAKCIHVFEVGEGEGSVTETRFAHNGLIHDVVVKELLLIDSPHLMKTPTSPPPQNPRTLPGPRLGP